MTDKFRQDPMGLEIAPNDPDEVPQIFVAIPNLGELVTFITPFVGRWVGMAYELEAWNLKFFFPCDHVPPSKARNKIHKSFINSKYDYLFTLDSDVVPPPDVLRIMLKYLNDDEIERHHISFTVQMSKMTQKGAMLAPSAFNYDEEAGGYVIAQGEGLIQVDMANLACCMRTRELMEVVGAGVYEEKMHGEYRDSTTGEDFVFTERVNEVIKEMGKTEYKPWIDYNHICSHYVVQNTRGVNDLLTRAEGWAKEETKRQFGISQNEVIEDALTKA